MNRFALTAAALLSAAVVAGCGSAQTATASPAPTVAPTTAPTAVPTVAPTVAPTAAPTAVHGYGDTPANPDAVFEAAASASLPGLGVIAYVTIAGTDAVGASTILSSLTSGGAWVAVQSIPAHGYAAVPDGFATTVDGSTTIRVYTATGGDPSITRSLTDAMFAGL